MPFESHQETPRLFQPDILVLPSAPSPRGLGGLCLAEAGGRAPVGPQAPPPKHAGAPPRELYLPRCRQKGCVFPAQAGAEGECRYHHRQSIEPACFESKQPTHLLLDQAKFGLPDREPDDERLRDRHRLAEQRVRFMLGDTV